VTDAGFIFAGYGLTTLILGSYATWVIRKRKSMARLLSKDDT
jgi:hypothetical protein